MRRIKHKREDNSINRAWISVQKQYVDDRWSTPIYPSPVVNGPIS